MRSITLTLFSISALILAPTVAGAAGPGESSSGKTRGQPGAAGRGAAAVNEAAFGRALREVTGLIGDRFFELNDCLDDDSDEKACFEEELGIRETGSYVSGIGFAIAAIFKFKFHGDGPLVPYVECLLEGGSPSTCTLTLDGRVDRLATLIEAYRVLRPYCEGGGVLCDRPLDWPVEWPWPFPEAAPGTRS